MSVTYGVAVYFMMWWILLFAFLPFGLNRTQAEAGEIVPGSDPGAPEKPRFLKVIILTTIVTSLLFVGFYFLKTSGFSLDDLPF